MLEGFRTVRGLHTALALGAAVEATGVARVLARAFCCSVSFDPRLQLQCVLSLLEQLNIVFEVEVELACAEWLVRTPLTYQAVDDVRCVA